MVVTTKDISIGFGRSIIKVEGLVHSELKKYFQQN